MLQKLRIVFALLGLLHSGFVVGASFLRRFEPGDARSFIDVGCPEPLALFRAYAYATT